MCLLNYWQAVTRKRVATPGCNALLSVHVCAKLDDNMTDETVGLNQPSSTQQNPLSKKLVKVLETNLDNDKDTLQALEVLSGFLEQNTLQARRNLRSDLEIRSVALNQTFLQCVRQLAEHVEGLKTEVTHMKECCDGMQRRLAEAKSSTAGLLKETADLKHRARLLDASSKAVGSFLSKFELLPDELNALKSVQREGVSDKFFQAVGRVKTIHEECKVLLRTSQQKAGLEIMESMAMHLETSYEQLYHWTQARCRAMNGEAPDVNRNLRQAIQELKERPILLQYCLDEYNIARRMTLVRLFIDALTREGSSGRPIELHSHDSLRYCSDMLGWLHQAVATENDHILALLPDCTREKAVAMLGAITEGTCHPLRVRIEQVVVSTTESVTAYRLVNLLRYYSSVFQALLGTSAPLAQTVADLQDLQSKTFFNTLNVQTTKILDSLYAPLSTLAPSVAVTAMLALLQKILASSDMNSLAHSNQEQDLKRILSMCLDPLLQHCRESVSKLGRLEGMTYLVNCLHTIHNTVALYDFTESHLEVLDSQMQGNMDSIATELSLQLMEMAGIAQFYGKLAHSQVAAEDFQLLGDCSEKLTNLIALPGDQQLAQCGLLTSSALRAKVKQATVEQFVAAYQSVYNFLAGELGKPDASRYLPYTPQQMRQLLL